MKVPIRSRLLFWLLATILPIFGASLFTNNQVAGRLAEDAAEQLENLATIEALHLQTTLVKVETNGLALAANAELIASIEREAGAHPSDLHLRRDLIAEMLRIDSIGTGNEVQAVRITDRAALSLGQTEEFAWPPGWNTTALDAMEQRRPVFGPAFPTSDGARLGLALPVVADDGSVVGSLLLEHDFDPLVATLASYEDVGRTTEASLAQRLPGGEVQAISIHRFDRDSAFSATHSGREQIPSVLSVDARDAKVITGPDYRGVETIAAIATIEPAGWGLTVKIDEAEALELSDQIRLYVLVATVVTSLVLIAGWFTFVRPLGRRLRLTADVSNRVADGDYESRIDDTGTDEISELSKSIDRLASDLRDDIAARESVEEELRFRANHDDLTGLINRQHASSMISSLDGGSTFSLLFIDLDRFKIINDTYGHSIGDEVLVALSRRLEQQLPDDATLARWGGDEFLVILPNADDTKRSAVASALGATLSEPIATAVGPQTVGMSIGGATSEANGAVTDILVEADAEMFRMKRQRASVISVPAEVMRMVESALSEDRVEPFYQPVVRVDEQFGVHLSGAEALVRIRAADGSIVPPGDFLPALGDHRIACRIDAHMIERSLADLASWHRRDIVPDTFRVAVNIGPAAMRDSGLLPKFREAIDAHSIDPTHVLVEVPETVENVAPATLASFRELGVRIAIDDVGVQFSNLERMVDLQADVAKLDRRWIPSMATAEVSKSEVLRSLVEQCNALGMEIIAEGIESDAQLEMLRGLGVENFQGFLFSEPLSLFEFERLWCRGGSGSFRGVASSADTDSPAA